MSIIVPNVGELKLAMWAIKDTTTPENLVLKIYSNDYTPVATSIASNFTEATFTGYSSKTLTRSSWSDAITDAAGKASMSYAEQSWSVSSSQTVYGYYVVGATSGVLIWAERFDGPRPLNNGDTIRIVPKITCRSEN